jgi:hypothetical protein
VPAGDIILNVTNILTFDFQQQGNNTTSRPFLLCGHFVFLHSQLFRDIGILGKWESMKVLKYGKLREEKSLGKILPIYDFQILDSRFSILDFQSNQNASPHNHRRQKSPLSEW